MAAIASDIARWAATRMRASDRVEADPVAYVERLLKNSAVSNEPGVAMRELPLGLKLAVLRELPPRELAVVVLHRRDSLTYEEIADLLRISRTEVRDAFASGLRRYTSRVLELQDD
jgi:DNA-directed RNA polymerase specialized sigma24 family protein